MISGIFGYSLTSVKAHWSRSGNFQSSFARNPEAATLWLDLFPYDDSTQILESLGAFIKVMLHPNRFLRPTIQQTISRLVDQEIMFWENTYGWSTCCPLLPSPPRRIRPFQTQVSGYLVINHFLDYVFLRSHNKSTCINFCACHLHALGSDDNHHDLYRRYMSENFEDFDGIRRLCTILFRAAVQNEDLKPFWDVGQSMSSPFQDPESADISSKIFSLKHVLSTIDQYKIRVINNENILSSDFHMRTVDIMLLPVCLPRSVDYGLFFFMVSFPSEDDPRHTIHTMQSPR